MVAEALSPKMSISGKELANGLYQGKRVLSTVGAVDMNEIAVIY